MSSTIGDAPAPQTSEVVIEPIATPKQSPVLLDSLLLLLLRLVFFYVARRYLLASLNPALRDLSKSDELPTHSHHSHTHTSLPPSLPDRRSTSRERRERANSHASVASVRSNRSASASTSTPSQLKVETARSASQPKPPKPSASDFDTEDEPYLDSGPSTPLKIHIVHEEDDSEPPTPAGSGIELNLLGAKLRRDDADLPHAPIHARPKSGNKRATRGLGRVARNLFAVCFAESMNLLTLVVFHTLGILHARARQFNFSVSLHVLLAIVLLVVPLVQSLLLTYRSKESSTSASTRKSSSLSFTSRLLISLIPFSLYIFLFTLIPPYITAMTGPEPTSVAPPAPAETSAEGVEAAIVEWSTTGPEGWEAGGWLSSSLGRVVVLGVVIMAALSGIGAVRTAWDYLELAAGGGRKITDADVLQAERSLYRVRQDVIAKRDELRAAGSTAPSGSFLGGVFGRSESPQTVAMRAELQGLQAMETDVARSLSAMKIRHKRQGFRSTMSGTIVNILGYIFAIYCGARIGMCLVSLFTPSSTQTKSNGDWISFLIALGVSRLPVGEVDVATWSRGISLLLTGLLILSSLTMVLRWLTRVLRLTSKTVGAGFLLLTLGQLYATYVISLLVQLRSSLPASPVESSNPTSTHRATDDSLLRSLPDFRVFGHLFDAVFLVAALGTALYRYIGMRMAHADDGIFSR